MSEMYKRIEALCKNKGVNVTQMCRDTGIVRGNLTDLKMGRTKSLSAKNAEKVASYFGVSVGYLLGSEENNPAALSGSELDKQLEGIDFALYGEVKDLTDDQKRDVLQFVQFLKQQKD